MLNYRAGEACKGHIMAISVRPLSKSDYQAWYDNWQGYLAYYKTELDDDISALTWQRLLDPDHSIQGLGAFDENGTMLGIVHYLFHPVTWSITDRCYLEDLFTDTDARGKGVGRALIAAVNEQAARAGAGQVYWMTEDFNKTAHRLYDKVATKTPFIKYAQYL